MTAYQKAINLLREHGPMNAATFAVLMWPRVSSQTDISVKAGEFLTEMRRRGLIQKNGWGKYYVKM